MNAIHVATVSSRLDLVVLERVLGGLESALAGLKATRIWVDLDGADLADLAVMAELPDGAGESFQPVSGLAARRC